MVAVVAGAAETRVRESRQHEACGARQLEQSTIRIADAVEIRIWARSISQHMQVIQNRGEKRGVNQAGAADGVGCGVQPGAGVYHSIF